MAVKRSFGADGSQSFSAHQSQRKVLLHGTRRAAFLIAAATTGFYSVGARGQLAPGIYLDQIGDGTLPASTTTQQSLFIDGFTPGTNAALTQIQLPTTTSGSVHAITAIADESGGTGFAQAVMQASMNGRYLVVGGTNTGTTRTIAEVDSTTSTVNTGNFSAVTSALPRSVELVDPTHMYYDGNATGLRYVTAPSSFTTPNAAVQRTVSIFNGQLFESGAATTGGGSAGAPGISVVGSGAQGSTSVSQTYTITTGADPEQFVLLDQNPSVGFLNNLGTNNFQTNLDLCYVATDNGVEKYVYNGTSWSLSETLSPTAGGASGTDNKITKQLVGVTYAGKDKNGYNVLYATTAGDFRSGTNEGNALMQLVDNGPGAQWQLVQDSTTNSWFRGLAVVKQAGDTNGDFHIDSTDFATLAANFGKTGVTDGFASGDFNYDGTVNALDFNALATNYGYDPNSVLPGAVADAAALGSVVPEPASISLLMLGTLALTGRRRMARSM